MQTYGNKFASVLSRKLHVAKEDLNSKLLLGLSIKSMEDYKYLTGQIKAINDVLGLFEVVDDEINKGE